jgi:hypothetical protein
MIHRVGASCPFIHAGSCWSQADQSACASPLRIAAAHTLALLFPNQSDAVRRYGAVARVTVCAYLC